MSGRLSIERLRHDGEAFMEELSREYFLAHAGLKASAELQPGAAPASVACLEP